MKANRRMAAIALLVVVALTSLFAGTANAQAISPTYVGKFTLTAETHWGKAVLQPGSYTITIKSTGSPVIALIRNANGDAFTGSSSTPAAVAGYPSVTVPCGWLHGLPLGLSLFAGPKTEATLLRFAYAFEQATKHRRPPRYLPTIET